MDLALMSEDVYHINTSFTIPLPGQSDQGRAALHPNRLPASISRVHQSSSFSTKLGFFAALYRSGVHWVLVFCGSNDIFDWVNNLQLYTSKSWQFKEAYRYTEKVLEEHKLGIEDVILAGHSLGGALAKFTSYNLLQRHNKMPKATYVFNAPGMVPGLKETAFTVLLQRQLPSRFLDKRRKLKRPSRGDSGGRIVNLRVDGDAVSKIGISLGHTIELPFPHGGPKRGNPFDKKNPAHWGYATAETFDTVITAHKMTTVLESLSRMPGFANQSAERFAERFE